MTGKSAKSTSPGASIQEIPEQISKSTKCRLYRKVLVQALKDASGQSDRRRLELGAWVVSRHFNDVCEWGGVKVDAMRQGFKQVLLATEEDRRPRCDRLVLILESAGQPRGAPKLSG
jgi:hypothetical protein